MPLVFPIFTSAYLDDLRVAFAYAAAGTSSAAEAGYATNYTNAVMLLPESWEQRCAGGRPGSFTEWLACSVSYVVQWLHWALATTYAAACHVHRIATWLWWPISHILNSLRIYLRHRFVLPVASWLAYGKAVVTHEEAIAFQVAAASLCLFVAGAIVAFGVMGVRALIVARYRARLRPKIVGEAVLTAQPPVPASKEVAVTLESSGSRGAAFFVWQGEKTSYAITAAHTIRAQAVMLSSSVAMTQGVVIYMHPSADIAIVRCTAAAPAALRVPVIRFVSPSRGAPFRLITPGVYWSVDSPNVVTTGSYLDPGAKPFHAYHSMDSVPGCSGSPILTAQGRAVGMHIGTDPEKASNAFVVGPACELIAAAAAGGSYPTFRAFRRLEALKGHYGYTPESGEWAEEYHRKKAAEFFADAGVYWDRQGKRLLMHPQQMMEFWETYDDVRSGHLADVSEWQAEHLAAAIRDKRISAADASMLRSAVHLDTLTETELNTLIGESAPPPLPAGFTTHGKLHRRRLPKGALGSSYPTFVASNPAYGGYVYSTYSPDDICKALVPLGSADISSFSGPLSDQLQRYTILVMEKGRREYHTQIDFADLTDPALLLKYYLRSGARRDVSYITYLGEDIGTMEKVISEKPEVACEELKELLRAIHELGRVPKDFLRFLHRTRWDNEGFARFVAPLRLKLIKYLTVFGNPKNEPMLATKQEKRGCRMIYAPGGALKVLEHALLHPLSDRHIALWDNPDFPSVSGLSLSDGGRRILRRKIEERVGTRSGVITSLDISNMDGWTSPARHFALLDALHVYYGDALFGKMAGFFGLLYSWPFISLPDGTVVSGPYPKGTPSGIKLTNLGHTVELAARCLLTRGAVTPVIITGDDALVVTSRPSTVSLLADQWRYPIKIEGQMQLPRPLTPGFLEGRKTLTGHLAFCSVDLPTEFPLSYVKMVVRAINAQWSPTIEGALRYELRHHPDVEEILQSMRRAGWGLQDAL